MVAPVKLAVGVSARIWAFPPPLPTRRYPAGQLSVPLTPVFVDPYTYLESVTRLPAAGAAEAGDAGRTATTNPVVAIAATTAMRMTFFMPSRRSIAFHERSTMPGTGCTRIARFVVSVGVPSVKRPPAQTTPPAIVAGALRCPLAPHAALGTVG